MRKLCWFVALLLAGCASEVTTPIDLNPDTTTAVEHPDSIDDGDDPNAEARSLAQRHADRQCLDDALLEQGVIEIVDPETEQVAGRITADCDEVRSRSRSRD